MPSAHRRSSRTPKYAGGGRRRRHCVVVRQIDATDPPFNPSAAETEVAGDLATGTAPFKKSPYLVEDPLSDGLAFAAYQARLSDRVRRTIQPFGKQRRRMIVAGIDRSISDRRFIAAKLSLNGLAEVLQQRKAIGNLPHCGAPHARPTHRAQHDRG
jgi:hypothetical protein